MTGLPAREGWGERKSTSWARCFSPLFHVSWRSFFLPNLATVKLPASIIWIVRRCMFDCSWRQLRVSTARLRIFGSSDAMQHFWGFVWVFTTQDMFACSHFSSSNSFKPIKQSYKLDARKWMKADLMQLMSTSALRWPLLIAMGTEFWKCHGLLLHVYVHACLCGSMQIGFLLRRNLGGLCKPSLARISAKQTLPLLQ